ncbi:hypothetical protein AaE_010106 [Aphanomyces astaci]|uniref:Uncharacterized protein n=1 Tax=Aphanomyces astaci TaxID=112090 RepID=A0A6A5A8M7_APHAT|nr:hypothetical protein AaE_010106 [Aphanomyces astaci]
MRLLQQAEYHIVYITAPTTAPRGDELKNFVRGGNVVVQFILLRSEVEDIQSTADSVMALVDATADMPSVSIVQSEDTLIDVRNTMKPWLRKLQAHMTAVVRWPPSSPDDMSATSLQLVLRSSFSLHETQESQWHLLHAGLAHLTALHVVPLDSVDGSVVIGLPLTSDAASDPCVDPVAVNMHYFLRTNQSGIVVKCRNKATSALEFYLLVAAGTTYSSQCPFMMYRLAPTDQVLLPPPTTHEPFDLPPIDTSFNPSIPNQRFNPFDYDSGVGDVTTHVVTPVPIVVAPQAVLPPARSLKTKARRFL